MSESNDAKRPIIIKRKKVVAGGHHGGAWKVAYADFVTAMMAFFMLMWLLNATTDKQRKGLADYFSPTIAMSSASSGSDGALGGETMSADTTRVQMGRGGVAPTEAHGTAAEEGKLEALEAAVLGKGGDSLLEAELLRHVSLRLTDNGLVLEFFDLPGSPLFVGAEPQPVLQSLLRAIGPEIAQLPNAIAIEAFTASEPLVTRAPSVWPLSQDRADALRRALPAHGVRDGRIVRITGHADRRPVANDPLSARNNRVEIIVLRDTVPVRR